MERGAITHKNQRPALQFLQPVGYIISPANHCKTVHLIVRHGLQNNSKGSSVEQRVRLHTHSLIEDIATHLYSVSLPAAEE